MMDGSAKKWLWVRNRYPKWSAGIWKHGLKPAICLVVFAFDPCPNTFGITSSWQCKQWRAKRNSPTQQNQKNTCPTPGLPVPVAGGKRHLLLFVGGSLRPASLLQLREMGMRNGMTSMNHPTCGFLYGHRVHLRIP